MLFNSLDFAIFLPVVFAVYWLLSSRRLGAQNIWLVVASYIFYGWWDWRFLSLIVVSSGVDYLVARGLSTAREPSRRRLLLLTSIATNIGLLGVFKYFNFFVDTFVASFTLFGATLNAPTLHLVLPVGISFYTFQTLSYSIDVYRRKIVATQDPVAFFAFVSFFPQLVAGPIERASNLLPQFRTRRHFEYDAAVDGMRQILWGFFKKLVVADGCASYVNDIFDHSAAYSGSTLVVGAVLFAFQIYGDFSGYSDIAIGTARLFGFRLRRNFAFPYFSRDIAEFWRRWHISLSTWFRDYVYIPLGGSRGNAPQRIRNTLVVFLVSGLWHGANWTFVIWGALHALYFLPVLLAEKNRRHLDTVAPGRMVPRAGELLQITGTFALTTAAWVFFRAENLQHAFAYLRGTLHSTLLSAPEVLPVQVLGAIAMLLLVEWLQRSRPHGLHLAHMHSRPMRWAVYAGICFVIYYFGQFENRTFIYFQF